MMRGLFIRYHKDFQEEQRKFWQSWQSSTMNSLIKKFTLVIRDGEGRECTFETQGDEVYGLRNE